MDPAWTSSATARRTSATPPLPIPSTFSSFSVALSSSEFFCDKLFRATIEKAKALMNHRSRAWITAHLGVIVHVDDHTNDAVAQNLACRGRGATIVINTKKFILFIKCKSY